MAVTIYSSPQIPTPVYNEQFLDAVSTQYAQPNFTFTIIVTDVITSNVLAIDYVKADSTGNLHYNIGNYAENLMQNYFLVNLYGWEKCADAIRKIRFNVGETYGTTPTYYAGADTDYIVWNAGVDNVYFAPYSVNYYCYDSTIPNYVYLTSANGGTYTTYKDRSHFLYALIQQGNTNDIPYITVKTYNAADTLIAEYRIARPSYSTGTYTDNYQCIDIGYKGLLGIASGLVTVISGTYPIITSLVSRYTIEDPTYGGIIQNVTIGLNPKFEVYTLHYLNSKGGYDTLHCPLARTLSSTKTVSTFKKSMWSVVANVSTLDTSLSSEKVQGVTIQDNLQLTSDWLTDAEFITHKDLFTSTDVRLDLGNTSPYKGVKVTQTGYTTKNNERLRNYIIELSYNHSNHRQRG